MRRAASGDAVGKVVSLINGCSVATLPTSMHLSADDERVADAVRATLANRTAWTRDGRCVRFDVQILREGERFGILVRPRRV